MKKLFLRILTAAMALLLLSALFVACVDPTTPSDDTTNNAQVEVSTPDGPETDAWGRPVVEAPVPDTFKAPDNTVITVLMRSNNRSYTREFYSPDEQTGETLNDSIFARNLKLEDTMNFKFSFIEGGDKDQVITAVSKELQSGGADKIDIVTNYAYYGTASALRNAYINLENVDYIDTTHPWWNSTYVDAAKIDDQLYFIIGDLNLSVVDRSLAIFYNRRIGNDLALPDFYDVVLNNEWTIETLLTATANTWKDENSNSTPDEDDFYGIIACSNSEAYDGFLTAFGVDYTKKNKDGSIEVAWDAEKVSDAIDKQIKLYNENNGGMTTSDWEKLGSNFTTGKALFHLHLIYGSAAENANIRNMQDPYGLLPLPKYTKEQESYRTTAQDAYNIMSVMNTSKNLDIVGAVLEQWNYESYRDILPIYCELIMKTRYLKDTESGQIFDIIVGSVTFDTGMVYGAELNRIATSTREMVKDGKNTFASTYKTNKVMYNRLLERLIDHFEERAVS